MYVFRGSSPFESNLIDTSFGPGCWVADPNKKMASASAPAVPAWLYERSIRDNLSGPPLLIAPA